MKDRRLALFATCVCLFLMSMFYRSSSAIIAPDLSRDLGLDPSDLGLLGAIFFYAFALAQPFVGVFLDRVGPKMTMVVLNCIGIAGAVAFARASGLAGGLIGRCLLGLGMSANLMGTFKLFTAWFNPRRFATVSGLAMALGALGSLAAATPLALLVQALGWRGSFYSLALMNGALTLFLILFVRDAPRDGSLKAPLSNDGNRSFKTWFSMKTLLRSRDYWVISFSVFLRYGSFASIQALWAGPFLIDYLGLSTVTCGNLLLMISAGFILGSPFGGLLSDRLLKSRKRTLIVGYGVASLAVFAVSRWEGPSYLVALGAVLFLFGFFNGFGQLSFAHIKELMPKEMSGTAMAGINLFTFLGAGVFIQGLGSVLEKVSSGPSVGAQAYQTAFLICSGALATAMFLYLVTRDSNPSADSAEVGVPSVVKESLEARCKPLLASSPEERTYIRRSVQ